MFLKLGTYVNSTATAAIVSRFKKKMVAANIFAALLVVAMSWILYVGWNTVDNGETKKGLILCLISQSASVIWQIFCSITWGWSLFSLYRDVTASKSLLPSKALFIFHGALLVGYLGLFLIGDLLNILGGLEYRDHQGSPK